MENQTQRTYDWSAISQGAADDLNQYVFSRSGTMDDARKIDEARIKLINGLNEGKYQMNAAGGIDGVTEQEANDPYTRDAATLIYRNLTGNYKDTKIKTEKKTRQGIGERIGTMLFNHVYGNSWGTNDKGELEYDDKLHEKWLNLDPIDPKTNKRGEANRSAQLMTLLPEIENIVNTEYTDDDTAQALKPELERIKKTGDIRRLHQFVRFLLSDDGDKNPGTNPGKTGGEGEGKTGGGSGGENSIDYDTLINNYDSLFDTDLTKDKRIYLGNYDGELEYDNNLKNIFNTIVQNKNGEKDKLLAEIIAANPVNHNNLSDYDYVVDSPFWENALIYGGIKH